MEQTTSAKTYRSPAYKLVQFFSHSRDRWKQKRKESKLRIKRLENRVAGLEISRQKWKAKARAQQIRIVQLTEALEQEKTASC